MEPTQTQSAVDENIAVAQNAATPVSTTDTAAEKRTQMWLGEVARTKAHRKELVPDWSISVDYRRGKPFSADSDNDRVQVPIDWAMTKAKQAQLFSAVPQLRLTHKSEAYKLSAPMFARKINDALGAARVGVAMDEVLPDCINAAGVGAVLVSYDVLTEPRDIPTVDQMTAAAYTQAGQEVPVKTVNVVLDSRMCVSRISPSDLLWDLSFTGSDFDDSAWLGYDGRKSWPDAMKSFKLDEAKKAEYITGDTRKANEQLSADPTQATARKDDQVEFQELYYKRYLYHDDETSYTALQRLVFIKGKLVIDEPWNGQKRIDRKLCGSRKFPIRVLTLTYLSDESIPPSDSAMGRPQVDEINEGRSQAILDRKRSTPLRWFDVNRVDPQIQTLLLRGTFQGIIPMNGDGNRAIGEVARAAYPQEDYAFANQAMTDIRQTWQVEDAVGAGPQIRSAEEARNRQSNFQTRIGYERARCAKFFVGIGEVVAGLLSLYGQFTPEELALLQKAGIVKEQLSDCYAFNVFVDSTLLLDAGQRIERLMSYLNMTVKSGFIDPTDVIIELTELHGIDPARVTKAPQPQGPEPMNVSLRLSGAADMNDVLVLAMLLQTGQGPKPESINAAKLLLANVPAQPTPAAPPEGQPPADGAPGAPPADAPPAAAPGAGPAVLPQHVAQTDAHPAWNTATRVEKRAEDGK